MACFKIGGRIFLLALGALTMALGCANQGVTSIACDPTCPSGFTCCGPADEPICRDLSSDPDHCGACGLACPSVRPRCSAGACVAAPGGPDAGMAGTDAQIARPDSGVAEGNCRPSCSSNERCCDTTCVARMVPSGTDGRTHPSFMNCGGCDMACDSMRATACSPSPSTGMPGCMCGLEGQCAFDETCAEGPTGFFCVNVRTDPMHCGEIGHACGQGETCNGGVCQCGGSDPCGEGQSCCGGACIPTDADDSNCGGCGVTCGADETCRSGMCICGEGEGARACVGFSDTSLGELCCEGQCVPQDNANCAGCGMTCGDGLSCDVGFTFGGYVICCATRIPFSPVAFCSMETPSDPEPDPTPDPEPEPEPAE